MAAEGRSESGFSRRSIRTARSARTVKSRVPSTKSPRKSIRTFHMNSSLSLSKDNSVNMQCVARVFSRLVDIKSRFLRISKDVSVVWFKEAMSVVWFKEAMSVVCFKEAMSVVWFKEAMSVVWFKEAMSVVWVKECQ